MKKPKDKQLKWFTKKTNVQLPVFEFVIPPGEQFQKDWNKALYDYCSFFNITVKN